MESFICNTCNAPSYRGKTPFSITQCGHIYCQACIVQAEKKCPQCQKTNSASVPLEEPLREPMIARFFESLGDSLAELQNIQAFQSGQAKIMDKKYETLKSQYANMMRHRNIINAKYQKLKAKIEQLEKSLKQFNWNISINTSSDISTSQNAYGFQSYADSLQFSGSQTQKRHICAASAKGPDTGSRGDWFPVPAVPAPRSAASYLLSKLPSGYRG